MIFYFIFLRIFFTYFWGALSGEAPWHGPKLLPHLRRPCIDNHYLFCQEEIHSHKVLHSFSWPAKTSRFLDPSVSPAPSTWVFGVIMIRFDSRDPPNHRGGPSSPVTSSAIQVIALRCFRKAPPLQQVAAKNDDCSKVGIREVCFFFFSFFFYLCFMCIFYAFVQSISLFRVHEHVISPTPFPHPHSHQEKGKEEKKKTGDKS